MKRIIPVVIIISTLFSSCVKFNKPETHTDIQTEPMKACWVSYLELNMSDKSETAFTSAVNEMLLNIKNCGLNTVFVHTISHLDAYYKSNILPMSKYICNARGGTLDYDPLEIICNTAKKYDLQIHAWINPFRILQGSTDLSAFASDDIAVKMITSGDATVTDNGAYLIPSSPASQRLILDCIREIIENYDIDGVHFDDYFYPTTDENFDKTAYEKYKSETVNPLPLSDYRRAFVDSFVSAVYRTVKAYDENLQFGISPQADIEKNRNTFYADIEKWCANDGFIDYIIPQIYFGFDCPLDDFKFENCLNTWLKINRKCEMYVGLGMYRSGEISQYGNKSSDEWVQNCDVIARQIEYLYSTGIKGFAIYSYTSLTTKTAECDNMKKVLI